MKVTNDSIGGAPVLPGLLEQIPADEKIASVSGDGTRLRPSNCRVAVVGRCAEPFYSAWPPDPRSYVPPTLQFSRTFRNRKAEIYVLHSSQCN